MTTIQEQITAISKAKREIERVIVHVDKSDTTGYAAELDQICDGLEDAEDTLQTIEKFRHIMTEEKCWIV